MHTELEFSVSPKADAGKGAARKLRADGKTPGVVYGPGMDPVMITFREQELVKVLESPAQRNVFLVLKSEDEQIDGIRTMVKDLQVDPLLRRFIHADFYRLDPNRVIDVTVPIRLEGSALGVKMGGILQVARRSILVSCLPDNLPEAIVVDVTEMDLGDSVHVGDLPTSENVTIKSSLELAVCAIIAPSGMEETGEEGEEGEEIEVTEGEEAETSAE